MCEVMCRRLVNTGGLYSKRYYIGEKAELKYLYVHIRDCPDLSDSTTIVPWPSPDLPDLSTFPLRFSPVLF